MVDSWERISSHHDLSTTVSVKIPAADVPWGQGQSRDLIDFNKPAEQTIMRDDNTLKAIQHLLDGQSSSDEATMVKPKAFVLPPIPPPPPLQAQTLCLICRPVVSDVPACLRRIDPHDSPSEPPEPIYVQYRRIWAIHASEFLLYDYTCYHFMYGTVLCIIQWRTR